MAEKHPIAVKHQHGTTINDGGRVVYRRMDKVVKSAEFVLDLPGFVRYSGLSVVSWLKDVLDQEKGGSVIIQTPKWVNGIITASEFNENGITGYGSDIYFHCLGDRTIKLSENKSEYYVEYEASFLRTDQVACSFFCFKVQGFICKEDQNPVLLASDKEYFEKLKAFGPGIHDVSVGRTGTPMKIPLETFIDAILKPTDVNATLRIVLHVQAEIYKEPKPQSTVGKGGVGEQCDPPFLKQLQDGEGSDVELICGNEKFPVHAFILKTVSRVFRTMLEVPMKEAATSKIVIKDLDGDTVKRMVDYIYHGRIDVGSNAEVVELLYAAEKYEFDLLKTACLERMITSMSDENVTSFLEISVSVNAGDDVIKQMVEYCMDRIQELRKRKDFQAFARANSNLFF